MYASGEEANIGDVVQGEDSGEVQAVTPQSHGGQEFVLVQWKTPREHPPGSGIFALPAPIQVQTRLLRLVSRNSPTHN
jgi:hypothetical protein